MNKFPAGSAVNPGNCIGTDCRGTGLFVVIFPYLEKDAQYADYAPSIDAAGGWINFTNTHPNYQDIVVPAYQCPSAAEWQDILCRKDYHGVMGGKALPINRNDRGDVYIDGVFFTNSFLSIADISDGTSDTLAVGEVVHPQPYGFGPGYGIMTAGGPSTWFEGGSITKDDPPGTDPPPYPLQYNGRLLSSSKYAINSRHMPMTPDFESDVPFSSDHPGGAQFVFCDGHVAFLNDTINFATYRNLSARADGEVIGKY